jgi:hypothetical protein
MRRLALLALLIAASCHRQAPAPPPQKHSAPAQGSVPQAQTPLSQPEAQSASHDAAGAADVLHHYYTLIQAGKYEDAWRMRSGGRGIDEAQFAAHFKPYESYHPQIGIPSRPVTSQGWVWVEVPVMTTGRFLGGKPFGSAGSVTLRRPAPDTAAPAGERGWRIYTG